MTCRSLSVIVIGLLLGAGCPSGTKKPEPVTAFSLQRHMMDSRHGGSSETIRVAPDGCYERTTDDPRLGEMVHNACLPATVVKAWFDRVEALDDPKTKRAAGPGGRHRNGFVIKRGARRRWLGIPGADNEPAAKLARDIVRAIMAHWTELRPRVGGDAGLGFSLVKLVVNDKKRGSYVAVVDTGGRWRCEREGTPFRKGIPQYRFSGAFRHWAGRVPAKTAVALLAKLFEGIDPTAPRTDEPGGKYAVTLGMTKLGRGVSETLLTRWRKLAPRLSPHCAMVRR